jgi:hypothetical protein
VSWATARAVAQALFLLSLLSCSAVASAAGEVGDVLPFRIVYGNPGVRETGETACYLWSEGGRLHVRITSDGTPREVDGEIRVTAGGVLKDVGLQSEVLRIRQPSPTLLQFDLRTGKGEQGFDVVLAGDIASVTIDVRIDGEARPNALRIGGERERPRGLPAKLALTGARASWIERFGFQ